MSENNLDINTEFYQVIVKDFGINIENIVLLKITTNDFEVDETSHFLLMLDFLKNHDYKNLGNEFFI